MSKYNSTVCMVCKTQSIYPEWNLTLMFSTLEFRNHMIYTDIYVGKYAWIDEQIQAHDVKGRQ